MFTDRPPQQVAFRAGATADHYELNVSYGRDRRDVDGDPPRRLGDHGPRERVAPVDPAIDLGASSPLAFAWQIAPPRPLGRG